MMDDGGGCFDPSRAQGSSTRGIEKLSGPSILSRRLELIGLCVVVQGFINLFSWLGLFFNIQIHCDNEKHKSVDHFYRLDHRIFCHSNVLKTPTCFYRADVEWPLEARITNCMFDGSL